MKLVLATHNLGKVQELRELLSNTNFEVLSLAQYPNMTEVIEDGKTFRENAIKKAREVCSVLGEIALADDSGLEVDYLNGAPGVYSARFAGEGHNDTANNQKLLQLLDNVPNEQRTARFRCVVAVATPGGLVETFDGVCEGIIVTKERGGNGFGYDPLFEVPEYNKTFAELDEQVKNAISHRGRALQKAKGVLERYKIPLVVDLSRQDID